MGLEALEFVERRQIRIVVIEMHDETDRHLVVVVVIEERAAAGRIVQRPAERMLDQALLVLGGIDLPDFLQPDAEFRRLALGVEREFRDQLLGQAAARAFGEQRVFAEQFHAAGEGILVACRPWRCPCRRSRCRAPRPCRRRALRPRQSPDRFRRRAPRPSAPASGRHCRASRYSSDGCSSAAASRSSAAGSRWSPSSSRSGRP